MRIFFSVGEPSGDQHAARLIGALKRRRPDLAISGYGGPKMAQAGCALDFELTNLAVVGLFRVLPLLWRFYGLVKRAERLFQETRPDAVVLVDFPGFNWWIARKAKAAGIPVFYYLPPQLWGWLPWRVRKMRKFVDHILCGLPFEPKWYAERGLKAEYVGHPFFDEVAENRLDEAFCRRAQVDFRRIVGILPGSMRNHEVEANFPLQIGVMEQVAARHPDVQFLVACYKERHLERCRQLLATRPRSLPVELFVGRTPEIIESSDCCVMVSGSVSLEMLARAKPAVVALSSQPADLRTGAAAGERQLDHASQPDCRPPTVAGMAGRAAAGSHPSAAMGRRRHRMDRQSFQAGAGRARPASTSAGDRPAGS